MSNLDATVAKRLDITVKQNQTFNATITLLNNDNTPINIAGSDVILSVRQSGCGCNACFDQALDEGFNQVFKQDFIPAITGGGSNVLQFDDKILLAEGAYKYDLLVKYPSGLELYFLFGSFKVKRSYATL